MFYSLYVSNGEDGMPPIRFLPANANAHGLMVVGNVAYAATSGGCGGADNGVWALDLASKQVTSWKTNGGGVVGSAGAAMGSDGTIYVAIGPGLEGAGSYSNAVAALEPKSLQLRSWYKPGAAFTSSPIVFSHKDRAVVAVASADGTIHLLDAANPGGADHKTALYRAATKLSGVDGLATWEDAGGVRWLLASGGSSVASWKVVDANGAPALAAGWVAREMVSPLTPTVMNGVVFAVSSGELRSGSVREHVQKSRPAILYALDSATGKELWNSGNTIASFARGGISGGGSQLYVTTHDSTLYAFGFPIEH
jgi:hypothetical protein